MSGKEVATSEAPGAIVEAEYEMDAGPPSLLTAIVTMARDPAVDVVKLERILAMQERLEEREAERMFTEALNHAQAEMPRVSKNGTIKLGGGKGEIPFAKWEDIDAALRPIMTRHGFSLSFSAEERAGGGMVITALLKHIAGHGATYTMPLGIDTGPGRNALQAMGSTLSYGKRYLAEMIFNIVREDEDDDGTAGGVKYITSDQAMEIEDLLTATGSDRARFMQHFGITSLLQITAAQHVQALNMLRQKSRSKASPSKEKEQ